MLLNCITVKQCSGHFVTVFVIYTLTVHVHNFPYWPFQFSNLHSAIDVLQGYKVNSSVWSQGLDQCKAWVIEVSTVAAVVKNTFSLK